MEEKIITKQKKKDIISKIFLIMAIILVSASIVLTVLLIIKPDIFYFKKKNNINVIEIKPLNLEKCLNNNDYIYYNAREEYLSDAVTASINSDKKSITLSMTSKFRNNGIGGSDPSGLKLEYNITGYDKKIKSVFVGGVGQSTSGTGIFAIMEDNTVTYVRLSEKKVSENNTVSYFFTLDNNQYKIRYVDDVHDVVKLYKADARMKQGTGHGTVIGAKADGSFYDLGINYDKDQPEPTTSDENEIPKAKTIENFDYEKVINKGNKYRGTVYEAESFLSKYDYTTKENKIVLNAILQDNKKEIILKANWKEMNIKVNSNEYTYTITNFDKKINKVYIIGWGQSMGSETIFYIMEDGSLEYTPITGKLYKEITDNPDEIKFKSYGKVPTVENIVKIGKVGASPINDDVPSWGAAIAIKENGSFYDLTKILDDTEEYK